ncbi:MAG: diguanylate cyclase [Candidatus Zixiibacteriota bacterium]|nr:MAG: diguanylate cyclase [candidate division Zixibacteria bacterium]
MIFTTKVRNLYSYLQSLILCSGFIWHYVSPVKYGPDDIILYILIAYAFTIMVFRWTRRANLFKTDYLIYVGQLFEAFVIALIIRYTGGIASHFFLIYFPMIVFISVYSSGWRAIFGILWYGLCFVFAASSGSFTPGFWNIALIKLGSIWIVGMVSFAVAHHMKSSEGKLLKTLDALNERTWELESSQAQLSNIYETTRALSGILNLEELLKEILRIARNIFRYKQCKVYLAKSGEDRLYLYAGLENDNRHIYEKPTPYNRDISGLKNLQDTGSMLKQLSVDGNNGKYKTVDVPMISRGKVIGIMQIIPESGGTVTAKERRLLMIFANSSAIAIDNSILHKKTQELTITDELTDLFNFRYFRSRLSDELKRADRYRQKLSILMLDIDHFKKVNDLYGHQTGNSVLREVSGIIEQCVRDVDVVARYGGEEFTVILPQTDREDAAIIAERIRETVAKNYFQNNHDRREIQITISIGGCTYPEGSHSLEQLLEKVDSALYRAKAEGRNVVFFAESEKKRSTEFTV